MAKCMVAMAASSAVATSSITSEPTWKKLTKWRVLILVSIVPRERRPEQVIAVKPTISFDCRMIRQSSKTAPCMPGTHPGVLTICFGGPRPVESALAVDCAGLRAGSRTGADERTGNFPSGTDVITGMDQDRAGAASAAALPNGFY